MGYEEERRGLVERLQRAGHLRSPRVVLALSRVPREQFVPRYFTHRAYEDAPIHIGHGQTISAPHMVAIMSEAVEAGPGMKILEVGTGSGYQAAILSQLVEPGGRVFSIERVGAFRERAREALQAAGVQHVELLHGDGSLGHPDAAPFDRIIVTAAAPEIPPPLLEQLAPGGILVIPVGGERSQLIRVRRTPEGDVREDLGPCAFVPLRGAYGQDASPFAS